jgi:hypothetical protein
MFFSFGLIFGALEEYWALLFAQAGLSKMGIGILWAAVTAAQVVAGLIAHRFRLLPDKGLFGAYLVSGASLFVGAYFMRPISAACVILTCFLWVAIDVVLESKLQHAIAGDARATVLSVRGFLQEVSAIQIFIGFGLMANRWGYRMGFLACAAVVILIGTLCIAFGRMSEKRA